MNLLNNQALIYILGKLNKKLYNKNHKTFDIKPFIITSGSPKNFIDNNLGFGNPELDSIYSHINNNNIKAKKIIIMI